jgi:hypothetical protein
MAPLKETQIDVMPTRYRVYFNKAGLYLVAACVAASLLIAVLGLPAFRFGIWNQSEPAVGVMHFLAGIAALGLIPVIAWNRRLREALYHPFVLLPLGLAIWILVTGPLQPLPRLAWFGTAQIGEGLFWFLDLAVFVASGMVLMRYPKIRVLLGSLALLAVLALVAANLHALHFVGLTYVVSNTPFVPYYFPDYLAFFGIFIVAILIATFRLKSPGPVFAACLLGAAVVFVSDNRAAMVLAFAMAPMAWLILKFGTWTGRARRRIAVAGALATPVILTLLVLAIDYKDMVAEGGTMGLIANSALSRQRLIDIVSTAVAWDPSIALIGSGWGSYSDLLAIHLPTDWAPLRKDDYFGESWDAVFRVDFHSHNYLTEGLFSSGVVGLLLVLAFTAALPGCCWRRHVVMAGALGALTGGLSATWFQLPPSMPFMALAWAGFAATGASSPIAWKKAPPLAAALLCLALIGGGLLYGGLSSLQFSIRAYFYEPSMEEPLYRDAKRTPCGATFMDQGRGGVHLAHRLRTFVKYIVNRAEKGDSLDRPRLDRLKGMICTSEDFVDRGGTYRLLIATLFARADLAFVESRLEFATIVDSYLSNWGERVDQALLISPKRTDLATSYLLWLLREGREEAFSRLSRTLYRNNPEDAVALWFSGIALLGVTSGTDEGLARMQKSLDKGIERIIPIDEGLRSQLRP